MTPAARLLLRGDVKQAEAFRQFPYFDCCGKPYKECTCTRKGKLTIGYGRNLDDVGLDPLEAEVLLDHDLFKSEQSATKAFQWFSSLSDLRQRAITEMVFNVGLMAFRGFRQTIRAIEAKQFKAAALHLLDSRWKSQVGDARSLRIARYLRDGQ